MKDYPTNIKSFQEIREEFEFVINNLNKKTNYYNKLISKGYQIPSAGSYYRYNNIAGAQKIKKHLELEINRKYILELTASFEAKTVYYFKKILKRGSTMHASYTRLVPASVRRGYKFLMYQHLIGVYKEVIMPNDNLAYSEFANLIDYRNWLAHGRSNDFPSHLDKFDFDYSYDSIIELISNMPHFPEKLKT